MKSSAIQKGEINLGHTFMNNLIWGSIGSIWGILL